MDRKCIPLCRTRSYNRHGRTFLTNRGTELQSDVVERSRVPKTVSCTTCTYKTDNLNVTLNCRKAYVHKISILLLWEGRDSSVGIATRYGLESPEIESRWWRDFLHLSRPALGPTQPPIQLVPVLSPEGGVKQPRRGLDHPLHLAPRLKKE